YSCIGATEAVAALNSPLEPEEWEDINIEVEAHGLVLLVVDLQGQHVRVPHIRANAFGYTFVVFGKNSYLGVKSATTTTAEGKEVNDDELVAGVEQGVNDVLRGLDLPN
uniref:Uncharacterized protein n=1 Tax=Triticum urartu TaxID=4572 RepID=A0A8R7VEV2_TRIUA